MFESDADRLAMIRALGGVAFEGPKGAFDALFDKAATSLGDLAVMSNAPQLTARSIDLDRAGVFVGTVVRGAVGTYLVRELKPDGFGMIVADLEQP